MSTRLHAASLLNPSLRFRHPSVQRRSSSGVTSRISMLQPQNFEMRSNMVAHDSSSSSSSSLQRANTDPAAATAAGLLEFSLDDVTSGGGGGGGQHGSALQQLLSLSACQPHSLFLQTLHAIRQLLGQPFWCRLRQLVSSAAVSGTVPPRHLQAWLLMCDVTGIDSLDDQL